MEEKRGSSSGFDHPRAEWAAGESATRGYMNFDFVAHEYDASRRLPPNIQKKAARLLRDAWSPQLGEPLLDAGVGTGRFALALAQLGLPTVGVDISANMLAQLCRKRAVVEADGKPIPLGAVRGDLRRLPLSSGVFGAGLMTHILHLIVDWKTVLAEVRRVLKPNGVLFLASESGLRMPTRDFYFQQARARGVLREHRGASRFEQVHACLTEQGASITPLDTERLRWTQRMPVLQTLTFLHHRSYSNLWSVPDADHAELMAATEAWVFEHYRSFDVIEESPAQMTIQAVRWPTE
jgi:ubiquinone/menaquinone biosynthesis C-methylase UbiE